MVRPMTTREIAKLMGEEIPTPPRRRLRPGIEPLTDRESQLAPVLMKALSETVEDGSELLDAGLVRWRDGEAATGRYPHWVLTGRGWVVLLLAYPGWRTN